MKEHPELFASEALRKGLTIGLLLLVVFLWLGVFAAFDKFNRLESEAVAARTSVATEIEIQLNANEPPNKTPTEASP